MSLFDFLRPKKKKGKAGATRREPRLMSIDGEQETPVRVAVKEKSNAARKKGSKKKVQGRKWYWRVARKVFLPAVVCASLFAFWIWYDLPDIGMIGEIKKSPGVTLKAEDGTVLGSYGDVYGDFVPYDQLPPNLINAVVATEDRNFFHHFGVDPIGLLRATFVNIRARHLVQGGSTITQQLAKNAFLTQEKNAEAQSAGSHSCHSA